MSAGSYAIARDETGGPPHVLDHLAVFEHVADLQLLRSLSLSLAVQGRLPPQDSEDEPAVELVGRLLDASVRAPDQKREAPLRASIENGVRPPWDVPETWRILRLEHLSVGGGLFSDGDWVESKDQDPTGEIRLIQLADVGEGRFRDRSNRFLTRKAADRLGCTFLETDDVLIARMPDPIGRACLFPAVERTCATVVDVCILRVRRDCFAPRYLMHALNSPQVRRAMHEFIAGTTRQRVSRGNIAGVAIPVPPLAEQKRIVAKVDQLMALCDELEAKQTKKREVGVRLTKAALTALTSAESPEVFKVAWKRVSEQFADLLSSNARVLDLRRALLELALAGRFTDRGAAAPPDRISLRDVVLDFKNGISKRRGDVGDPVPVLRLADIKAGRIAEENLREIVLTAQELTAYAVLPGDILVIRVNGSADLVGRFIPCTTRRTWAYSDHLIRVRIDATKVDPRFLCLSAGSSSARKHLVERTVSTAGQRTINQTGLGDLELPLPPLAEQKRIVAKVGQLMALCDELEVGLVSRNAKAEQLAEALVASTITPSRTISA